MNLELRKKIEGCILGFVIGDSISRQTLFKTKNKIFDIGITQSTFNFPLPSSLKFDYKSSDEWSDNTDHLILTFSLNLKEFNKLHLADKLYYWKYNGIPSIDNEKNFRCRKRT